MDPWTIPGFTGEIADILIGETPYRCGIVASPSLMDGSRKAMLLSNADDEYARDSAAATILNAGALVTVRWDGDVHPTHGDRCYRIID